MRKAADLQLQLEVTQQPDKRREELRQLALFGQLHAALVTLRRSTGHGLVRGDANVLRELCNGDTFQVSETESTQIEKVSLSYPRPKTADRSPLRQ